MTKLTKFVHDFKEFMEFVNQTHRISDLYIKRFEKIFSVTKETLLLREIQDIKDELNMLKAVFEDQRGVLEKAGKDIAGDRQKSCKTRSSAFNFQQQSEKHARHIERMHVQATQAYNTVSQGTQQQAWKILNCHFIIAQRSFGSQAAASKRARGASQPEPSYCCQRARQNNHGLHDSDYHLRK